MDRGENKIALNVERALAANFTIGGGASYSVFDFDEEVNNDGSVFTIGPWIEWKITELIGLFAGIAYNDREYEQSATSA